MSLLTEWEGCTGNYLARGHGVWTECSEVSALWLRAKCFPIWPNLTQLNEYFTIPPLVWVCGAGWLFPN